MADLNMTVVLKIEEGDEFKCPHCGKGLSAFFEEKTESGGGRCDHEIFYTGDGNYHCWKCGRTVKSVD